MIDEGELAAASRLLADVERVLGGPDAPLRAAIRSLSEGAGGVDPWSPATLDDPSAIHRPWRWLAAAATRAEERGDDELALRVYLFMFFWTSHVQPRAGVADYADMWLDPVPADAKARIAAAAMKSAGRLPDEVNVAPLAPDAPPVAALRPLVARTVLDSETEDAEAQRLAQALVG